ncbi:MAG TPA: 3-deoxy-D-manno-octulosonic acid transferase [Acidobacteriota bacterium]|nr:3-deoxy-D-manno-octulosonic acid transferase [Acidobacteriota bacterium]
MRYLYSALLTLAAVVTSPYWVYRALREKKYFSNFRQRLGFSLPQLQLPYNSVWIHAVSVGEVLAAKPLLSFLRTRRPDLIIVVSTVTLTGQALAQRELAQAAGIFYFPFDWAFCIRRVMNMVRPRAVILMETELWPNFLRLCKESGIPVFLANGRISDSSLRRYRHVPRLTRFMLDRLLVVGAQTQEDKRRFGMLGAVESRICVTGNLKFDFKAPNVDHATDLLNLIRRRLDLGSGNQMIVVGSSMRGEEGHFLEAFQKVKLRVSGARLVIAPRHPERFGEVADLITRSGIPFLRRSEIEASGQETEPEILLLDTIGELRAVYLLAEIAVIGGSFLPFGGHNLLEPAALGKAIVFGPDMSNFKEMAGLFLREQAARRCALGELSEVLADLLINPTTRSLLGQRAVTTFRQNQGAAEATAAFILPHL